jgi:group I intron endonuclease
MIIYKITNIINNKSYIGQTRDLERRIKEHYSNAINVKLNRTLYAAIRKYGWINFVFETVEECTNKESNEKEIYYIKYFNTYYGNHNGYNMTEGGETPWNYKISMKELGYIFENRKPRPKFTNQQKLDHSIKIKASEKYYKGLKNREHGMSKKVLRISDGKIWETIKECSTEIGVHKSTVRRYIYQSKPIKNEKYIFLN